MSATLKSLAIWGHHILQITICICQYVHVDRQFVYEIDVQLCLGFNVLTQSKYGFCWPFRNLMVTEAVLLVVLPAFDALFVVLATRHQKLALKHLQQKEIGK